MARRPPLPTGAAPSPSSNGEGAAWCPRELDGEGPLYVVIADALAADIRAGRLRPGERLPTHRHLARSLGVNVVTATRAYAEASRRGLVEGEVGRGTFVRSYEEESLLRHQQPLSTEVEGGGVDFQFNDPACPPGVLDLPAALRGLLAGDLERTLTTGYLAAGLPEHRAAGARWLSELGRPAVPERLLVCCGAQHAMTVALSTVLRPGDRLATEELTYPGLKALAQALHVRLVGVPMDADGLRPDALEELARKGGIKAVFCVPTLQNPTGVVTSRERRDALVEVARRHDLILMEDDTTACFHPEAPPALVGLAPERTVHVSSLSKALLAGLRIGYLFVPREAEPRLALERFSANVAATHWMAPPLMAELASRWIEDGTAMRVLHAKRAEVSARWELFREHFPDVATTSDAHAGFVWLDLPLPWRAPEFVAQCARRGVAVSAAESFVVGRSEAPHAVRLALGRPPTRALVTEGLARVAELFLGPPSSFRTFC